MQTKTLLFGLTMVATALAAPVAATVDSTVTTQGSGAGIWKRASDAEMSTNGAGIWKRAQDGKMQTAGAGIWKREEAEKSEEDGMMHTSGAGIWKKSTEVCCVDLGFSPSGSGANMACSQETSSESAPQLEKRTGYGIISGGNDEA